LELSALYRIRHYWLQRSPRWQPLVSGVPFHPLAPALHDFNSSTAHRGASCAAQIRYPG
jgi:hypothetical protein